MILLTVCAGVLLVTWRPSAKGIQKTTSVHATRPAARPAQVVRFEEGCVTAACHPGLQQTARPAHSACDACHEPDAGGHVYPLRHPSDQVCRGCHETARANASAHDEAFDEGCTACHQPHTDAGVAMLRGKSAAETCVQCHPSVHAAVPHPPFANGECGTCHESHGTPFRSLMGHETIEKGCSLCHAEAVQRVAGSPNSHRGVKGSCSGCHDAHGSDVKGLLATSPRAACIACHPGVDAPAGGGKPVHHPVLQGERCEQCHDPHGSTIPGMLKEPATRTCLNCHGTDVHATDGRTLAAIPEPGESQSKGGHGSCGPCHTVHGGSDEALMRARASMVPIGSFQASNYAMCFGCHDQSIADERGATWFRDGDRNLHALHLRAGDQSRGCAACHVVHAAAEPRLIAKQVKFEGSGWQMEMRFELTRKGGRCGAGCHEALEYSREHGGARGRPRGGAE